MPADRCRGLGAWALRRWLAYVASLVWSFSLVHHWAFLGPVRTVLTVAGGAGAAAVLALVFPSGLFLKHEWLRLRGEVGEMVPVPGSRGAWH